MLRDATAENTHVYTEHQLKDCAETHNTCEQLLLCLSRWVGRRSYLCRNPEMVKVSVVVLYAVTVVLIFDCAKCVCCYPIPVDSHSSTQLRDFVRWK